MLYTLVLLALAAACPYCNARVADPEPFIAILILILFCATSVSALALQATVSLTLMFPAVPEPPLLLWIDTLPEPSAVDSCAPVSSPPVGGRRGDLGGVRHLDVCRGGLDETAVAAVGRARIERAGDMHRAVGHAAQERDGAGVLLHRACFDDAGVVDNTREQRVLRPGAQ